MREEEMNEYQRKRLGKLKEFKKAPPATAEPRHDGGGEGWRWVCAGCRRACSGRPARREGNNWFCGGCPQFPQAR